MEPVAVRGEHLALVRTRAVAESGFELVAFGIFETNDAGQLGAMVFFDEADLPSALAELDARYLAGEGAEHLDLLAAGAAFLDATRRDDFDAMRDLMAPDFAWVDHGLLGMGAGDREQFITTSGTRRAVSADGVRIMRSVEVDRNAVLAVVEVDADHRARQ